MSKTSDTLLLYEKSKTAMLVGLGYLAAKDPVRAVHISVRIGHHLFKQFIVDSGFYTKLLKEEVVDVEYARAKNWYAVNRIPKGTIVTTGSWMPLILLGGYTVYAVELTEFDERVRNFLGVILPNDENEVVM